MYSGNKLVPGENERGGWVRLRPVDNFFPSSLNIPSNINMHWHASLLAVVVLLLCAEMHSATSYMIENGDKNLSIPLSVRFISDFRCASNVHLYLSTNLTTPPSCAASLHSLAAMQLAVEEVNADDSLVYFHNLSIQSVARHFGNMKLIEL